MTMLKSSLISENKNAKVLVVFGGNEYRRDEIISLLSSIPDLTIYGTLSEQEGIQKIKSLNTVDLILIGGRYTANQRETIKKFIAEYSNQILVTEPGVDYPYSNENIFNHINNIIKNETTSKI